MLEPMTVWVEVWPVAADNAGMWLLSGSGPWEDGPVMADSSEHFAVESILRQHGIDPADAKDGGDCLWTHSTSWHPDGPRHVDTYLVVVDAAGRVVRERWPHAAPVIPYIYDEPEIGTPPTHGATEEPEPRLLDVLYHGLGHLKDQIRKNATTRAAVGDLWRVRLEPFEETLAGMYSAPHQAA